MTVFVVNAFTQNTGIERHRCQNKQSSRCVDTDDLRDRIKQTQVWARFSQRGYENLRGCILFVRLDQCCPNRSPPADFKRSIRICLFFLANSLKNQVKTNLAYPLASRPIRTQNPVPTTHETSLMF